MSGITELTWQYMTGVVNEMKSPNSFLQKLLFPSHEPVNTEVIELSMLYKDRSMAPFVKKNGEALLVAGHSEAFANIAPPNIRIKMPFTPSELLFGRRPGTNIYPTSGEQMSAIQKHIAYDLQGMSDMVTNSVEWLCAMAIQGVISYTVNDTEAYQITYPIPTANKITLTLWWNDANPLLPTMEEDFTTAKRVVNDAVGLGVTDAIMGLEAAAAFRKCMKAQGMANVGMLWNPGTVPLAEQFTDDGVIFMGTFCGVRCWEYGRTIPVNGVTTSLIRSKYVEFVSMSSAAERRLYYGAIADFDAMEAKLWQGERFSKSWLQKDPSAMLALLASRPLPALRRPGAGVSMKVISG